MLDTQIKCMSFLFLWLTTGKVEARTSKSCKGFAFYHVSGEAFGVFQRLLVPTKQKENRKLKISPNASCGSLLGLKCQRSDSQRGQ